MTCYVCDSSALRRKFSIPLFDGPYQGDTDVKSRTIYECDCCGHLSADFYDPERYAAHYAKIALENYHYVHDSDLSRYETILKFAPKRTLKRVLDIGCATGTFLNMLPPGVERFGIEPSELAAECARAKGINIIQYEDLAKPELRNTFDLVTAIDVVEHTKELGTLRKHIVTALRPGGSLAILTGNAETRPAKVLGRFWYYLNYAEHVSCFSSRSMRIWLQTDFSRIEITRADHHPLNSQMALPVARAWLLFPIKWAIRTLVPSRMKFYTALWAPGDHMLVFATRS